MIDLLIPIGLVAVFAVLLWFDQNNTIKTAMLMSVRLVHTLYLAALAVSYFGIKTLDEEGVRRLIAGIIVLGAINIMKWLYDHLHRP